MADENAIDGIRKLIKESKGFPAPAQPGIHSVDYISTRKASGETLTIADEIINKPYALFAISTPTNLQLSTNKNAYTHSPSKLLQIAEEYYRLARREGDSAKKYANMQLAYIYMDAAGVQLGNVPGKDAEKAKAQITEVDALKNAMIKETGFSQDITFTPNDPAKIREGVENTFTPKRDPKRKIDVEKERREDAIAAKLYEAKAQKAIVDAQKQYEALIGDRVKSYFNTLNPPPPAKEPPAKKMAPVLPKKTRLMYAPVEQDAMPYHGLPQMAHMAAHGLPAF